MRNSKFSDSLDQLPSKMWLLYFIVELLLKTCLLFIILFVCLVLFIRLWFETTKFMCQCKTKLNGKTVLVTGANAGIGMETAKDLARRGARVIIASRNVKKSEKVVKDIIEATGNTNVEYRFLDLAKFSSIRKLADDLNKDLDHLDILVNNAGGASWDVMVTEDGIEYTNQINYVGPFLLTNLLLNKLMTSKPSRIVNVSSLAHFIHRFDINDLKGEKRLWAESWFRYNNTKLMQILWTRALAKRLPDGVTVNALHPGIVNTDIWDPLPTVMKAIIVRTISLMFKTPLEGAQTTIHMCVAPELANSSGGFYADAKPRKTLVIAENQKIIDQLWEETVCLIKEKITN